MSKRQRIPNRLRQFRKIAGLTQVEVAKKLGLKNTNRISKWEKGEVIPNGKNIFKLALLYRTPPHQFYLEYLSQLQQKLDLPTEHTNYADEFF